MYLTHTHSSSHSHTCIPSLSHTPPRFLFDRSQSYMEQRRCDEAILDLNTALELLPGNPSLLFYRGSAFYARALGREDDSAALRVSGEGWVLYRKVGKPTRFAGEGSGRSTLPLG